VTADLAAWLLAGPIAEDERRAQAWQDADQQAGMSAPWGGLEPYGDLGDLEAAAIWRPARVLAECAAKRAIVEAYRAELLNDEARAAGGHDPGPATAYLAGVVRILGRVYAGRPGWREEWAT
jgi:hypothetical protein